MNYVFLIGNQKFVFQLFPIAPPQKKMYQAKQFSKDKKHFPYSFRENL